MRDCQVRPQRHRPPVACLGLVQPARVLQRRAEIGVRLRHTWGRGDGAPQARDRLRHAALLAQRVAEIAEHAGVARHDRKRLPIARLGRFRPVALLQRAAEIVECRGIARLQLQHAPVLGGCLLGAAEGAQHAGQVVEHGRVLAAGGERAGHQSGRGVMASRLVRGEAEEVQALGMVGIAGEDRAIGVFRLLDAAGAVQLQGARERGRGRRGHASGPALLAVHRVPPIAFRWHAPDTIGPRAASAGLFGLPAHGGFLRQIVSQITFFAAFMC